MYILSVCEFLYINKKVTLFVSFIPNCIIDESKPLEKKSF